MEIAENITWTEELERLDVLLSQGQFELLLPGERYGGGEKEIWLVYLMNDAAESFLVFHDAELTGTYQKEYEGEIDAALEKDGEQYVLIVRQKETVCTLFFSRLSLEVHLFDYGKTGHFWVDGYEYLRQIEFRIAILRDKLEYLGEAFCTEEEMRLASLANFPPLNFCCYPAVPDQYLVPSCPWWEATEEAITEMKKLASEAGDKVLLRYLALYENGRENSSQNRSQNCCIRAATRKSWIYWKKTGPRSTELPETTLHWRRRNPDPKNPGAGNETEKDTGSRRKTRIIAARGAILLCTGFGGI